MKTLIELVLICYAFIAVTAGIAMTVWLLLNLFVRFPILIAIVLAAGTIAYQRVRKDSPVPDTRS